jgi:hypothetical protein
MNCSMHEYCWRNRMRKRGASSSRDCWLRILAIPNGRWTRCATSSMRKRFVFSRRIWPAC